MRLRLASVVLLACSIGIGASVIHRDRGSLSPRLRALFPVAAGRLSNALESRLPSGAAQPIRSSRSQPDHRASPPRYVVYRHTSFLWQDGAYHRLPYVGFVHILSGIDPAVVAHRLNGPMGRTLDLVKYRNEYYWFHGGYWLPVIQFPETVWHHRGHLVTSLGTVAPVSRTWLAKISVAGRVALLRRTPIRPNDSPSVLALDGVQFVVPYGWTRGIVGLVPTGSDEVLTAEDMTTAHGVRPGSLVLFVYPQSDRSPTSPLWIFGQIKVLPRGGTVWDDGQGVDYQVSDRGGDVTIGTVQPLTDDSSGYAFHLQMTVPPAEVSWAWTLIDQWSTTQGAPDATLTGSTTQFGTPIVPVTVVGPTGTSANTWAEIDTGNESDVLIAPALAQSIGLTQTGTTGSVGVNGEASEPTYSGLSVSARTNHAWMVVKSPAEGWVGFGSVQLDLGQTFLKYATLTDNNGHWTLTWTVQ